MTEERKPIVVDIGAAYAILQESPELCAAMNELVGGPALVEAQAEIERLRAFVGWVESWVSNPVGAYSVSALDGLFSMTRDKIAALNQPTVNPSVNFTEPAASGTKGESP